MTRDDFKTEKRAIGWVVVRSDGAILGIGFENKKAAEDWMKAELDALFPIGGAAS